MADTTANDAEIAAALASVEEADAAALACASGTTNGAVLVAGGQGKGGGGSDDDDDDASSLSRATAAAAGETTTTATTNNQQPPPPPPPPAFERPTDEQIVAQENEIRAAIAGSAALIGKREPLSALRDEYRNDNASVFAAKAEALSKRYGALRRARGDGNCFFRSFMFALAEGLLERRDLAERNRVVTRIRQSAKKMTDAGFDAIVFEDALEAWCDQLNRIDDGATFSNQPPPLTLAELEAASGEDSGGFADMGVMLLRLLTSAELRARAEFFEPFVLADAAAEGDGRITDVNSFCARRVEPMGCESDHVHIVALTDALGVAVRIEYLDRSEDEGAVGGLAGNHHDFVPEGAKSPPVLTLLYRPGHYDILYPI